jgi:hypothetical protein
VGAGTHEHSYSVEDLIKRLGGSGTAPSRDVLVGHSVSVVEDEPGSDPYNHTGRFRKIFK